MISVVSLGAGSKRHLLIASSAALARVGWPPITSVLVTCRVELTGDGYPDIVVANRMNRLLNQPSKFASR
jgi:hypothetical protein